MDKGKRRSERILSAIEERERVKITEYDTLVFTIQTITTTVEKLVWEQCCVCDVVTSWSEHGQ